MHVLLPDDRQHVHAVNPDFCYEVQPILQPSQIPAHETAQAVLLFGVPGIPDPCMLYTALTVAQVAAVLNGQPPTP